MQLALITGDTRVEAWGSAEEWSPSYLVRHLAAVALDTRAPERKIYGSGLRHQRMLQSCSAA